VNGRGFVDKTAIVGVFGLEGCAAVFVMFIANLFATVLLEVWEG